MEKNEIETALQKSRKSFSEKTLPDALHTQKKDSRSISDVSQKFIEICALQVMHSAESCKYLFSTFLFGAGSLAFGNRCQIILKVFPERKKWKDPYKS